MTTIRSTDQKAAMLRSIAARREQGHEWVAADDLVGEGRSYDRARTVAALVHAGMLEQAVDGAVCAYRLTAAGAEWVVRDQDRDSLGRRRGGPRSGIPPEVIARAKQLLAERNSDGRRTYRMGEVADLVGISRHTLSLYLNPHRRRRRLEQRRANYKGKGSNG